MTVDLNGVVAVRARGEGEDRPAELVLARSGYTRTPARFCVNRDFMARALRLGLSELEVGGPEDPVASRNGGLVYAFQPLSREGAIGAADDVIRIESGHATSPGPARGSGESTKARSPVSERTSRPCPEPPGDGPAEPSNNPGGGAGLTPLIQEGVARHDALGDARARAARLIGALRRERKRSRLLTSTLAQLRALKLQEVAE